VPFDDEALRLCVPVHTIHAKNPRSQQWRELRSLLEDFQPEVALVCGWASPAFIKAARWLAPISVSPATLSGPSCPTCHRCSLREVAIARLSRSHAHSDGVSGEVMFLGGREV